jgi:hemerythrin superfamily protein
MPPKKAPAKKTKQSTPKAKTLPARKVAASNEAKSKANDIVTMILEHHKPLKKLIKVLKNPDFDRGRKEIAFEEFAPLLLAHAEPEETALYEFMKERDDLRTEAFEGATEHEIASRLIDEIEGCDDDHEWCAKAKVLAESVEHHIEEEEEDMLPDFKKKSSSEERIDLGKEYTALREKMLSEEGLREEE